MWTAGNPGLTSTLVEKCPAYLLDWRGGPTIWSQLKVDSPAQPILQDA